MKLTTKDLNKIQELYEKAENSEGKAWDMARSSLEEEVYYFLPELLKIARKHLDQIG